MQRKREAKQPCCTNIPAEKIVIDLEGEFGKTFQNKAFLRYDNVKPDHSKPFFYFWPN